MRVCARDQSSPGTPATEPLVSACSLPCVLKRLINPTQPLTATCEDRPLTPLQTLLQSCFSHTSVCFSYKGAFIPHAVGICSALQWCYKTLIIVRCKHIFTEMHFTKRPVYEI